MRPEAHVLVVGGVDSSGGAGIARDVETIASLGLRASIAVTAVAVQTHTAVRRIAPMPPGLVAEQMRAALDCNAVKAVKLGVLGTAAAVDEVVSVLRDFAHLPAVLDPVLAASSGSALLADEALGRLAEDLMPICRLVTPNLPELAVLTGSPLAADESAARQQGEALSRLARTAVLVKGGHASGIEAADLLVEPNHPPRRLCSLRLAGTLRGTGCMLASAVAVHLARGMPLEASVRKAKDYVFARLARSM